MKIVTGDATRKYFDDIIDLYNYEIKNGTAIFNTELIGKDEGYKMLSQYNIENHPLIVAVDENNSFLGFASLSAFSKRQAYSITCELSLYVSQEKRGTGVGKLLMSKIIDLAKSDERTHNIISVITSTNSASIVLHKKFGFSYCGTLKEVGMKFGKYLDVDFYNLKV